MSKSRALPPTDDQAAAIRRQEWLTVAYCGSAGLSGLLRALTIPSWTTALGLVSALEWLASAVEWCWAIYLFVTIANWRTVSRPGRINKALILALMALDDLGKVARWLDLGGRLRSHGRTVENGFVLLLVGFVATLMLGILVFSVKVLHDGTARDIRELTRGRGARDRRDAVDDDSGPAIGAVGWRNAPTQIDSEHGVGRVGR